MDQKFRQDTAGWLIRGSLDDMTGNWHWLSAKGSAGSLGRDTYMWLELSQNVVAGFQRWESPEREPSRSQLTLHDLVLEIMQCHLHLHSWRQSQSPIQFQRGRKRDSTLSWESDQFLNKHAGLEMLLWLFFRKHNPLKSMIWLEPHKSHKRIRIKTGKKHGKMKSWFKRNPVGTSLVVQWLRLWAPNAGGPGSIPGQGTRSHVRAATKEPACLPQLRPGATK